MRWLVRVEGGPGDPPYDCVVLKHGGTENTEEPVARFSIPYSLCVSVPLCLCVSNVRARLPPAPEYFLEIQMNNAQSTRLGQADNTKHDDNDGRYDSAPIPRVGET